MPPTEHSGCPLCHAARVREFAHAHARRYFECEVCGLVFLDPGQRLGPAAERERYETHENDPADPGYRAFLNRLAAPLAERLAPGAEGLDYGSGPGPTLSLMLEERGFSMAIYDPFFAPDEEVLGRTYDFVTCSETAEHFFRPGAEFERLERLLRPGGWLALMTEMLPEERDLQQWRYARDDTHVCFYRPQTMAWIAERFGWSMHSPHRNVVLFRKEPGAGPSAKTGLIDALARVEAEVAAFFGSLEPEEFVLRAGEAWTPAEHLRHLNRAVATVARALSVPKWLLRLRFGRARQGSRTYAALRDEYRARLAAGAKATAEYVPAPRVVPEAGAEAHRREVLARWAAVNERLRAALARWGEAELERVRLPHPILGWLTAREVVLFTLYHNRHHIEAARRRLPRHAAAGPAGAVAALYQAAP